MANRTQAVPEGFHTATPYLVISNATSALDYYQKAFDATEVMRITGPGTKIGHAEIQIGDSRIMLSDEFPEMGSRSPKAFGGSPVSIHLYVENADEVFRKAIAAGGRVVRPVEDRFYGDRTGCLEDPYGHVWHIATHKEEVSLDEIRQRAAAMLA